MGNGLPGGALDPRCDPGRPCRAAPRRRARSSTTGFGLRVVSGDSGGSGKGRHRRHAQDLRPSPPGADGTTFTQVPSASNHPQAPPTACSWDGLEVVQTAGGPAAPALLLSARPSDAAGPVGLTSHCGPVPAPTYRSVGFEADQLLHVRAPARTPAAARPRATAARSAPAPRRRTAQVSALRRRIPRVRPARPSSGLDHGFLGGMMDTARSTKVPAPAERTAGRARGCSRGASSSTAWKPRPRRLGVVLAEWRQRGRHRLRRRRRRHAGLLRGRSQLQNGRAST